MSAESTDQPKPAPTLLDEKTRLECEKLKAEIETIQKPHRTTAFYAAVSSVIVAVIGLCWSWSSGWFDVQRTRVNNEKSLVEAQTERLKAERFTLEREALEQRAHVTIIEGEVVRLRAEESALTNHIVRLERDRDEMRSAKEYFESEAKRLAGSETNALRLFTELQAAQASRERLAVELQGLQATNYMLWASVSNQLELLRQADDVMQSGVKIALSDKLIYPKFIDYIGQVWRVNAAIIPYLPEFQIDEDVGLPPGVHRSPVWHMKTYEEYINEAAARATNQPTSNRKTVPAVQQQEH